MNNRGMEVVCIKIFQTIKINNKYKLDYTHFAGELPFWHDKDSPSKMFNVEGQMRETVLVAKVNSYLYGKFRSGSCGTCEDGNFHNNLHAEEALLSSLRDQMGMLKKVGLVKSEGENILSIELNAAPCTNNMTQEYRKKRNKNGCFEMLAEWAANGYDETEWVVRIVFQGVYRMGVKGAKEKTWWSDVKKIKNKKRVLCKWQDPPGRFVRKINEKKGVKVNPKKYNEKWDKPKHELANSWALVKNKSVKTYKKNKTQLWLKGGLCEEELGGEEKNYYEIEGKGKKRKRTYMIKPIPFKKQKIDSSISNKK